MSELLLITIIIFIKIAILFGFLLTNMPAMVMVERKVLGFMQERPGPNRMGPFGLLQAVVDGMKLFFKEDIYPAEVDRPLYHLAPLLVLAPALVIPGIIPFGPVIEVYGRRIALSVVDLDLGLIFLLGMSSMTVYGLVLAGWSSNNKWSLLGGFRSAAQMISYEMPLALAAVGLLLVSGSFNLRTIVDAQQGGFWHWNFFAQPLGFFIFFIAGTAEINRAPFDLPEGESELTGGFHTEYSSMRFALFFIGEYTNLFLMSAIMVALFFGGYHLPWAYDYSRHPSILNGLLGLVVFLAKANLFVFIYVWIRATLPRLRYDQLMGFGWKVLLPAAFLNLVIVTLLVAFGAPWWLMFIIGMAVVIAVDAAASDWLGRRRRRDLAELAQGLQRNA